MPAVGFRDIPEVAWDRIAPGFTTPQVRAARQRPLRSWERPWDVTP
jgi:hypothetical protein